MEYQIALGEVEDKGLNYQEHAGRGKFQMIYAVKGGSREKVKVEPGKGNNDERGGDLPEGLEGFAGFENGNKEGDRGVAEGIV